jgi:hypothetical protein
MRVTIFKSRVCGQVMARGDLTHSRPITEPKFNNYEGAWNTGAPRPIVLDMARWNFSRSDPLAGCLGSGT